MRSYRPHRLHPRGVGSALCGDGVQLMLNNGTYPTSVAALCNQAQELSWSPCLSSDSQCTSACAVAAIADSSALGSNEMCLCPDFSSLCPIASLPRLDLSVISKSVTSSTVPIIAHVITTEVLPTRVISSILSTATSDLINIIPGVTDTIATSILTSTLTTILGPTVTSTLTRTSTETATDTQVLSRTTRILSSIGPGSAKPADIASYNPLSSPTTRQLGATTTSLSSNIGHSADFITLPVTSSSRIKTTLTISGSVVVETVMTTSTGIEVLPGASSTPRPQSHESHAGVIVAAVLAVVIAPALAFCFYRRWRRRKPTHALSDQVSEAEGPIMTIISHGRPNALDVAQIRELRSSNASLADTAESEYLPAYKTEENSL